MSNLSQVGTKKIVGGFVGTKRIMEECIYLDRVVTSVITSAIPRIILVDDVDYTTLGFTEINETFNILSIDKATRTLKFDYYIKLRYSGTPPKQDWKVEFTTSDHTYVDIVPIVYDSVEQWYELEVFDYGVIATYSVDDWDNMIKDTIIQEKKIIYKHIPYNWKSTTETNYDYDLPTINDVYARYRPCKVYENKIARITVEEENSKMWEDISTPIIWRRITKQQIEGEPIEVSSGDNEPTSSYLPDPYTLSIRTCGIVREETFGSTAYYMVDFGDADVTANSAYVEPYVIALPSAFDYPVGAIGRVNGTQGKVAFYRVAESGTGITYYYYKCIPI